MSQKLLKVWVNGAPGESRQVLECVVVKENLSTYTVRTPEGHVITRKKSRDLVEVK